MPSCPSSLIAQLAISLVSSSIWVSRLVCELSFSSRFTAQTHESVLQSSLRREPRWLRKLIFRHYLVNEPPGFRFCSAQYSIGQHELPRSSIANSPR